MPRDNATLLYAVRGRVVLRFLGEVALGSGLLALVPLVASLGLGDTGLAARLAVAAAALLAAAAVLRRLPLPARLQANEALVVVGHQDPIHATALHLVGSSLSSLRTNPPEHASVTTLTRQTDGTWERVAYWAPPQA